MHEGTKAGDWVHREGAASKLPTRGWESTASFSSGDSAPENFDFGVFWVLRDHVRTLTA